MARMLIISTHGSEDPTRAGIAFFLAKGAVEAGHRPEVVLAGDAAVLARKVVAESVLPVIATADVSSPATHPASFDGESARLIRRIVQCAPLSRENAA